MGWLELRFEHDSGWGILGYPALFSEGYPGDILGYPWVSGVSCTVLVCFAAERAGSPTF